MSIKKYTDWSSWWDGLRTNLVKCIGTTGSVWMGTNALASTTHVIKGIDWEQTLAFFGAHIAIEVFTYLKNNQPAVITETIDTTFTSKNAATGSTVQQSSTKTTITPINNENKTTTPVTD